MLLEIVRKVWAEKNRSSPEGIKVFDESKTQKDTQCQASKEGQKIVGGPLGPLLYSFIILHSSQFRFSYY
jgi:hypothetical protein